MQLQDVVGCFNAFMKADEVGEVFTSFKALLGQKKREEKRRTRRGKRERREEKNEKRREEKKEFFLPPPSQDCVRCRST